MQLFVYLVSFSLTQLFRTFLNSNMRRFYIGLNGVNHFTLVMHKSGQIFENCVHIQNVGLNSVFVHDFRA